MFIESAATRTCPPPGGHVDIQSSDSVLKEDMDLLAEVRISRRIRLINMALLTEGRSFGSLGLITPCLKLDVGHEIVNRGSDGN